MKKLITAVATTLLLVGVQSQAIAGPQQEKMKSCSAEYKAKGIEKSQHKAFMSECMSAKGSKAAASAPASSNCEDNAVDKNGKKLAGAAKKASIKKCEAEMKGATAP